MAAAHFPTFAKGLAQLTGVVGGSNGLWHFYECATGTGFPLSRCFVEHDALVSAAWLCAAIIVYSFVFSIVGDNCSKVDQIWSVTPWVFGWLFYGHYTATHASQPSHPRLLLVCLLMTAWGARLTFNFWRRGGYGNGWTHEEDYRWPILRKIIGNWFLFLLFNISFIASYQNILLFLIALPAYGVMKAGPSPITAADIVLSVAFLILLVVETVADQQHYDYQEYKHSLSASARKRHINPDIRDGFLRSGLFRYSRHPNYFAEQAMWVVVFLFTATKAATAEQALNVYSVGPILLILLFQGSVAFSEGITAKKYPLYADYQKSVSQMIPFFPSPPSPAPPATRASARKRN